MSKDKCECSVFAPTACVLGEAPVWDDRRGGLFWLDILGKKLFFKAAGAEHSEWELPWIASAIFLPESDFDGVVLATEVGLATVDLAAGRHQVIARTGDEAPHMRPNDGGVDPAGRIWFGTMAKDDGGPPGAVYSWSAREGTRRVLDEISIPNTFVWTGDGRTFVMADSRRRSINRFSFNQEEGALQLRGQVVDLSSQMVEPDGSAMDVEDQFWNAQWDGGRVVRFGTNGARSAEITVPTRRPTSCCFGGVALQTLFITSASVGLSASERDEYPLSGSVFQAAVDVPGRAIVRVPGIGVNGGLGD
jgi:sugar lactone lactonase YvrE